MCIYIYSYIYTGNQKDILYIYIYIKLYICGKYMEILEIYRKSMDITILYVIHIYIYVYVCMYVYKYIQYYSSVFQFVVNPCKPNNKLPPTSPSVGGIKYPQMVIIGFPTLMNYNMDIKYAQINARSLKSQAETVMHI